MNTLYCIPSFFFLLICTATAQLSETPNSYYLQISPGVYSPGKMEMIIMVASDPDFGSRKLGSGELQFLYDTTMFENPVLTSHQLPATYGVVNLTTPTFNKTSFNFNLNTVGTGMQINTYPLYTEVARITFDLKFAGSNDFVWTDNIDDTKETILYFDDEDTLRHPTQMLNVDNIFFAIDLQDFILSWKDDFQNDALVQWITASEDNSLYFEVERSFDGYSGWTKIGEVDAQGTSNSATSYMVTDEQVSVLMPREYVYYRIKEVNVAGEASYSEVASLKRENKKENNFLSTYPNPFVSEFSAAFSLGATNNAPIQVAMYNNTGQLVYSKQVLSNQSNLIQIPTHDLSAGIYHFHIQTNDQSLTQQVVKQK